MAGHPTRGFHPREMKWAPCRYWESSSPHLLGHFYHSLHKAQQQSVFKSVISPFCTALSDKDVLSPSELTPAMDQFLQVCFSWSFMTRTNAVFLVYLPNGQTLKHSVTSLCSKSVQISMGLSQVRHKWKLQAISMSGFLARITLLLRNKWQPQGCQYHPGIVYLN